MHKFFAKTLFLGKKVHYLPQCHSTNEEAQKLISSSKAIEGEVVIAKDQTKGKGQRGNSWESEAGKNLTCSIILKPSFLKVSEQFMLHIVTSLAIHDALFNILGSQLKIKWPNDIFFKKSKLAGILIENSIRGSNIENSVIGIGLNINQIDFNTEYATSLCEITLDQFEVNEIAENILQCLESRYLMLKNNKIDELRSAYHSRMYLFQEQNLFQFDGSTVAGKIVGIDSGGKLLIEIGGVEQAFDFKEIEFLRNSQ
ncbi:MAG: biotin--[acetyl-CoA-carboxylase] ligase [Cyclobacteriaceae bacterium]